MSVRSKGLRGVALTAALLAGLLTIGVPSIAAATDGEIAPPTSDALPAPEGSSANAPVGSEDLPQVEAAAPPASANPDTAAPITTEGSESADPTNTRTLSGTVNFPAGVTEVTLANSWVVVRSANAMEGFVRAAQPAPDGSFGIEELPEGDYTANVEIYDKVGQWTFRSSNTDPNEICTNESLKTNANLDGEPIVIAEDDVTVDFYLCESGFGGITILLAGALRLDAAVNAVHAETGESVSMVAARGGRDVTAYERTLIPGDYFVSVNVNGTLRWYNPTTGFTETDRAKIAPISVKMFEGTLVMPDVTPELAPDASTLTEANRNGVQAPASATPGGSITVLAGKGLAGQELNVFLYFTPQFLGQVSVDSGGYIKVKLPAGVTGDHRIVLTSGESGHLIGWSNIKIGTNTLANTGSASIATSAVAGTALLLAGAATILASRRRATATSTR